MKPAPGTIAKAIRSILKESIAPEVRSPEALHQLRRVMGVLRDCRWEEAGFDLLRENEAIAAMLVASGGTRPEAEAPRPASFAAANAENLRLRAEFCTRIDALRAEKRADASALRLDLTRAFQTLHSAG